jgi:tRNA(adenine34) deaminase
MEHDFFMREAIREAQAAAALGETPVGAVVVRAGEIVGRGHNLRETIKDPTAHAEMIAIRQASETLGGWRLIGCTLYVTLEPCIMCAGAMVLARLPALVFGAFDPKAGAVGSVMNVLAEAKFNHQVAVTGGVLAPECGALLTSFFQELRLRSRRS